MNKHIPNALTSLNLVSGCIGIVAAFNHDLESAAYLIVLAAVFDFLDGFVAGLLNVSSSIGKDLDSLADMVSFGVLPSVILYLMLNQVSTVPYLPYLAFLIPVFSAIRLAKFNNDTRQSDSFIGLPTPANAFFWGGLVFLSQNENFSSWLGNQWVLLGLTIVFSWLMVAEVRMLALKFKNYSVSSNLFRYILVLVSIILIAFLQVNSVSLIILVYLSLSVAENFLVTNKT